MIRYGGDGAAAELVCGTVQFDHPAAKQLIALLPPVICIDSASPLQSAWLHHTLMLMAAEANAIRVGGKAIVTRLADVLVIQAIRAWIKRIPPRKQVGCAHYATNRSDARSFSFTAIRRMHGRWLHLADAVAMSRSAFAARFTELVGMPVMQYITHWRMHVAYSLLQEPNARIADLANRLGYNSEAAFSRAFKRCDRHVSERSTSTRQLFRLS